MRLVLGTSMGGMQTWMWGERYPDMMDALLPIASLPERVDGRNLLWRRLLIKIIQLGADERRRSLNTATPEHSGLAWNLFQLMVDSPVRLTSAFARPRRCRQPHRERRRRASEGREGQQRHLGVRRLAGADPSARLGPPSRALLAVNFADEELNPVELPARLREARPSRQVRRGPAVTGSSGTQIPQPADHDPNRRGLAGQCGGCCIRRKPSALKQSPRGYECG